MNAFEKAEAIAASIDHPHQGPNSTCAIRDRILSAIHEENGPVEIKLQEARELLRRAKTSIYEAYAEAVIMPREGADILVQGKEAELLHDIDAFLGGSAPRANEMCWCAAKSEAPGAVCPIHPGKRECDHEWVVPDVTDAGPGSVCKKCRILWLPGEA